MKVGLVGDSIDIERMNQLVASPAWALIQERMNKMYADYLVALKNEDDHGKLRYAQGFVRSLEACQRLPKTICDEIRAKQQKAGR